MNSGPSFYAVICHLYRGHSFKKNPGFHKLSHRRLKLRNENTAQSQNVSLGPSAWLKSVELVQVCTCVTESRTQVFAFPLDLIFSKTRKQIQAVPTS